MNSTLNLRGMMSRVHAMETSPLSYAERPQQEMGEHGCIFCLRLDSVEHFIHCSQRGAEAGNEFITGERYRRCILW